TATPTATNTPTPTHTPMPAPTATATLTATATPDPSTDTDGDGCTDGEEAAMGFDPGAWYDFYDVPVPAAPDPTPSGVRNRAVNFEDVLAILIYVGTEVDGDANLNGVDYDSLKDGDWNGDTVVDAGDKVGRRYDRSPSPPPNPPADAGPPDGAVNFQDVLAVLQQLGLGCSGPP
ncbi:MAG: flexitail domain-containing putative surface protein, partial [Dehalococcoidia bacterium]